ncbi:MULTISPECIES: HdeD family acid-resistance protein [unclassified Sphingomonas]|uniref:HdeD family acid-resistance protein n=1 Tax=unclassified Sphingomonas TaxID=196159 RepID=UPI0006FF296D|nr:MULTISPECIES: DUF308 domain-containing protein [unclassified Sphingomonas]KQM56993.1 hypothetical protein ASE65_14130 [Sphingomonas sp. Leaf16]KQN09365.1 hypothetical protein ASE81_14175 [Sphingomonas sp. Leaf29]KQN17542.1 hypothetical protein ASE83_14110 [Sphingomonas sp. Leaf32]
MTDFTRNARTTGPGWGWTLAYGIVSVLIGILAFAAPFPATLAATMIVGFFFLAGGAASLVAAFRSGNGRGYALLFGLLSVVAGGYMVLVPVGGALSLTLLMIVWLGARGIMELFIGFRFKRLRVPMLLLGALNIVLAILLYTTVPWSALTLPGYILGASFLFGGIVAIMGALSDRREQSV